MANFASDNYTHKQCRSCSSGHENEEVGSGSKSEPKAGENNLHKQFLFSSPFLIKNLTWIAKGKKFLIWSESNSHFINEAIRLIWDFRKESIFISMKEEETWQNLSQWLLSSANLDIFRNLINVEILDCSRFCLINSGREHGGELWRTPEMCF